MDKNELRMEIEKCEALFERRKFSRTIVLVLIYSAVDFWIICAQDQFNVENIWHILGGIGGSIFLGFCTFCFNAIIWSYVSKKAQDEERTLEYLRKRLKEKEQEQ